MVFTEMTPASVQGEGYLQAITLTMIENGMTTVVFDKRH
jgi:hypothetical protein